jgi:23S rRNA pseudouridine2605 synthase
MARERLQKILAQAGVASRRAAETLIVEGRVRVNGRIVRELGTRADARRDRVEVNGKRLVAEKPVYYLMHKPRGVVTTLDDPEGRKTIRDLVENIPERVFPVGRLDFQTSGALLLTNDGAMAQALLHPTRAVPKVYSAKLQGIVDDRGLDALREGVVLDDGSKTAPATVACTRKDDRHTFLEITITEGKNRQIHRMGEAIGRPVLRLTRLSFAGLELDRLRPGQCRPLSPSDLNELKQKYLNPAKFAGPRGRRQAAGAQPAAPLHEFDDEPMWTEPAASPAPARQAAPDRRRAPPRPPARKSAPARKPPRRAPRPR